jgi:hypothetical protein
MADDLGRQSAKEQGNGAACSVPAGAALNGTRSVAADAVRRGKRNGLDSAFTVGGQLQRSLSDCGNVRCHALEQASGVIEAKVRRHGLAEGDVVRTIRRRGGGISRGSEDSNRHSERGFERAGVDVVAVSLGRRFATIMVGGSHLAEQNEIKPREGRKEKAPKCKTAKTLQNAQG